jgi:hypothetical protein
MTVVKELQHIKKWHSAADTVGRNNAMTTFAELCTQKYYPSVGLEKISSYAVIQWHVKFLTSFRVNLWDINTLFLVIQVLVTSFHQQKVVSVLTFC